MTLNQKWSNFKYSPNKNSQTFGYMFAFEMVYVYNIVAAYKPGLLVILYRKRHCLFKVESMRWTWIGKAACVGNDKLDKISVIFLNVSKFISCSNSFTMYMAWRRKLIFFCESLIYQQKSHKVDWTERRDLNRWID